MTVYATLGEEAVEFAISEVAAETIFTSETLLPKVRYEWRRKEQLISCDEIVNMLTPLKISDNFTGSQSYQEWC